MHPFSGRGWRPRVAGGRLILNSRGDRGPGSHSQVPGLSHQVPGSGVQHQVQVRACTRTRTRGPVPVPEAPYLIPDQPRPETRRCASALKGKLETGKSDLSRGRGSTACCPSCGCHFQVAGGGHRWRVAGRCSAQTETGDREVCCGSGKGGPFGPAALRWRPRHDIGVSSCSA